MHKNKKNLACLALLSLSICLASSAVAKVYKWTDENGQTHYTATPPPAKAKPEEFKDQKTKKSKTEIWAYQVKGKEVTNCARRPEVSIDEVWNNLEKAAGVQFDISRNSSLTLGYILQNKEKSAEYTFYPNKRSCELTREGIAAYLQGDTNKINEVKNSITEEQKLNAMTPSDIPKNQKQDWLGFFAGCTEPTLKKRTALKGSLQQLVNQCGCVAKKYINMEEKNASEDEIKGQLIKLSSQCESELS